MTATLDATHTRDQAEMMLTLERATAALRCLPSTSEEIRSHLGELGCRGHVGDVWPTALEVYLEESTGSPLTLSRETAEWGNARWAFTISLPKAAVAFQWEYDAGTYPELYGEPTAGSVTIITADELRGLAPMGE